MLKGIFKTKEVSAMQLSQGDVVLTAGHDGLLDLFAKPPEFIIVHRAEEIYWQRNSAYIYFIDPTDGYFEVKYFVSKKSANFLVLQSKTKVAEVKKPMTDFNKMSFPKKKANVTIGTDPEVFVIDQNAKVIPAWEFLGDKKNPNTLEYPWHEQAAAYWDGFQAEISTTPGQTCLAYLTDDVQKGLAAIYKQVKLKDKDAKLSNASVVTIDNKVIESASDEHVQFGCMPSFNVYGIKGEKLDGRSTPYRFAGGHIHIGFKGDNYGKAAVARAIRCMDAIAGVACVSLFAEYDFPIRRKFYGLAGEYRTPSYGIEYRTLSNAWLMHPLLMHMTFDIARIGFMYGINDNKGFKFKEDQVIRIIQECDVDGARALLKKNKKILSYMLNVVYFRNGENAVNLFMGGLEKFIENPADIIGNWKLANYANQWHSHSGNTNACFANAISAVLKGKKV